MIDSEGDAIVVDLGSNDLDSRTMPDPIPPTSRGYLPAFASAKPGTYGRGSGHNVNISQAESKTS